MLRMVFSDEAFDTPGYPGVWYCRVGVVPRPGCDEKLSAQLGRLKSDAKSLGLMNKAGELNGTHILNKRKQSSSDAARFAQICGTAEKLCDLAEDYVDLLVVEGRRDLKITSSSSIAGAPLAAFRQPSYALELEIACQFLLACTDYGVELRSLGQPVAVVPLFDELVATTNLRHAVRIMSEQVCIFQYKAPVMVTPVTYLPSPFHDLLQLADVYSAFIRQELEGRDADYSQRLRTLFEKRWTVTSVRTKLWRRLVQ
jgi:hypothetical protein